MNMGSWGIEFGLNRAEEGEEEGESVLRQTSGSFLFQSISHFAARTLLHASSLGIQIRENIISSANRGPVMLLSLPILRVFFVFFLSLSLSLALSLPLTSLSLSLSHCVTHVALAQNLLRLSCRSLCLLWMKSCAGANIWRRPRWEKGNPLSFLHGSQGFVMSTVGLRASHGVEMCRVLSICQNLDELGGCASFVIHASVVCRTRARCYAGDKK